MHKFAPSVEVIVTHRPTAQGTGSVTGGVGAAADAGITVGKYHGALGLRVSFTKASTATLSAKFIESDNEDLSDPSDVPDGAIAQMDATGEAALDVPVRAFSKPYAGVVLTVGSAASGGTFACVLAQPTSV